MKILYHHRIASKDGQYVHVEELTNALKKLGHEIIMVGPRVVEQKEFGSDGGWVAKLKKRLPRALYEMLEFCYTFFDFLKLAYAVVRYKPDGLYERYNLFTPAGIWIKIFFKLKMLLEVNAPLFNERDKYNGIYFKRFAKWTENYTWRNADVVLPVTKVLANIIQMQSGVPEDKIVVIPNGIDPAKFSSVPCQEEAKERLGLTGKFVLGFTGFVREWHRLDLVLDVMCNNQLKRDRVHLLVVGDGPAREQLQVKAKNMGLDNHVTFTGIVSRENVASYVSAFDVALLPDVVDYASPLKLFEYLALGKPIIAPPGNNIKEVLTDGVNAVLVPFEKKKILEVVGNLRQDLIFSKRLSLGAFETIEKQRLTWRNNANKVVTLFL